MLTGSVVETEGQRRLTISVTYRRKRGLGWRSTRSSSTSACTPMLSWEADYELIKDLHTEAGLIDAYDAAVI